MSFNRFSSLKTEDSATNRFKSNQRYKKYDNIIDNSNNYVPPHLKVNNRWKKDENNSIEQGNAFKKKYHQNRRFHQNRRRTENHVDNKKLQKIGEFNFDIALQKSKKNKDKKNKDKKDKLNNLSKDNKNRIDFKKEEEEYQMDEEDWKITLAMAEKYQYYTESEEEEEEEEYEHDPLLTQTGDLV
jgi:hypothetical protein